MDYWNRMVISNKKPFIGRHSFDLSTPRDIVMKEDNKLINKKRTTILKLIIESLNDPIVKILLINAFLWFVVFPFMEGLLVGFFMSKP